MVGVLDKDRDAAIDVDADLERVVVAGGVAVDDPLMVPLTLPLAVVVALTDTLSDIDADPVLEPLVLAAAVGEPDTVPLPVPDGVAVSDGVGVIVGVILTDSDTSAATYAPLDPLPNSPYVLSPQHVIAPVVVRAHVCACPDVTTATPVNTGI